LETKNNSIYIKQWNKTEYKPPTAKACGKEEGKGEQAVVGVTRLGREQLFDGKGELARRLELHNHQRFIILCHE